jgi:NAD(P)-dependent dehydrogenase (short-subunit alcohol dehydrogenase family)
MMSTGTRVVILGGTSGLGYAVAEAVIRDGGRVVVASKRPERVEAAAKTLGVNAEGRMVDLSDEASIKTLFAAIGPFDHLVYTAGDALLVGALESIQLAAAREFFGVRVWGAFAAVKYGAPLLRPGGSIVLTTGAAGRRPHAGWSVTATLCTAMEGLTRALAIELAPIRVNLVCPGVVRTPLWGGMTDDAREVMYRQVGATLPVGRVGEPEDLAEAYMFLMRERYATGQVVVVDGGYTVA